MLFHWKIEALLEFKMSLQLANDELHVIGLAFGFKPSMQSSTRGGKSGNLDVLLYFLQAGHKMIIIQHAE